MKFERCTRQLHRVIYGKQTSLSQLDPTGPQHVATLQKGYKDARTTTEDGGNRDVLAGKSISEKIAREGKFHVLTFLMV